MQIIHKPYGQGHPYEQLPEERFPRQPLAGQPFKVGVVTLPPGKAKQVKVLQQLEGQSVTPVEARNLADWKARQEEGVGAEFLERMEKVEQDAWEAELTAPAFGQTLTYWFEADGVRSADFVLRGENWRSGGGWTADGSTMTISRHAAKAASNPSLPELVDVSWLDNGQCARRVRLTFRGQPDEGFFGLGERFNALNQRGNIMDIRVYEQYKDQGKRTYMPIPFLLSSAGYGLYVNSSRWMQFDLAASDADHWTLEADLGADETLKLTWFSGDDPVEIVGQFSRMTGPAALPPTWAFGLWMSANEWNSQARVEEEVKASLEHGIPPSVIVIEAWSDEISFYIWNDAQYTPRPGSEGFRYSDFTFPADGLWTDPKGMTDWLHTNDVKLVLWQIPVLKALIGRHAQQEADQAYFEQEMLGVRETDGSLYKVRPFWFRGGYLWDPTNPAARDWWLNKRAYLLDDMGVDGFKTDGGEHMWGADTLFNGGRGGDELWNEYPLHYTQAYYQFANSKREAITFSRSGYTGSQRAPIHWAGDENSSWEAYRHSILAGLSAGISGIPFWSWDLAGFTGDIPSADLYLRGTAMAAFCPVMQYHSEYNANRETKRDRTPWNIEERTNTPGVIDTFRFFLNVRRNLLPYIWQEAQHSATTGEPMMRALKLYDNAASDYEYYFGRDLLVCPIVEPGVKSAQVYLPIGQWYSLWDGTVYSGGAVVEIDTPMDRIPVFVRDGATISVCLGEAQELGSAVDFSVTPTHRLLFSSGEKIVQTV